MDPKILSLRFNQDQGCFTCSLDCGARLYNVEPLVEKAHYDLDTVGSIALCEMIYRTNWIAMVSGGNNAKYRENQLAFFDDVTKKFFLTISVSDKILSVRIRRDKIAIALKDDVYVFSFPEPTRQIFYFETRPNPLGILEISPQKDCDRQIVLFPGPKVGSLQILDLTNTEAGHSASPIYIQAHQNELACIALNQQGTKVATASVQGTLIRVWDTMTRTQILELRRGSDPATIFSLNFDSASEFLCCSSDKGTVHIFAVKDSSLNKRLSIPNSLLGKYGESQWAFANFTVPPECACICAFGKDKSVVAVGMDGTFHQYNFNMEGTCNRELFDIFLNLYDDELELDCFEDLRL